MALSREMPEWPQAGGWGAVSASGLLIGAAGAYYSPLPHTAIARAMTFTSGVLRAVVAVELVVGARWPCCHSATERPARTPRVVSTPTEEPPARVSRCRLCCRITPPPVGPLRSVK